MSEPDETSLKNCIDAMRRDLKHLEAIVLKSIERRLLHLDAYVMHNHERRVLELETSARNIPALWSHFHIQLKRVLALEDQQNQFRENLEAQRKALVLHDHATPDAHALGVTADAEMSRVHNALYAKSPPSSVEPAGDDFRGLKPYQIIQAIRTGGHSQDALYEIISATLIALRQNELP